MSGCTSNKFAANGAPKRPIPVWISSKISKLPSADVLSRKACKYVLLALQMPDKLWIGSTITAHTSEKSAAANAAKSFNAIARDGGNQAA